VGRRLAASVIPPGDAVGYPLYRLEWQSLGSLPRRIRNCMTGVRAEPFAAGGPEILALQAWLAVRDEGRLWQAPAVRP
jgi:L-cysteine S-thiosulfotransferase